MQTMDYKFLRFTDFKSIFQWDLKRYLNKSFTSKYSIDELGIHIDEESSKYAISEPGKQYGILGVNNQTGIFDAYLEDGAKIKQKYKKMKTGWIAYNPYRVNVGSIGIKKEEHKYEYISPAYVVFSCKSSLLPDYLFLTMKTPTFNKIIKDNTTGSVRQNLSFGALSELTIPMPSLSEQEALIKAYKEKIQKALELEEQASQIEKEIKDYLLSGLGLFITKKETQSGIKLVRFKDVNVWGVGLLHSIHSSASSVFPVKRIKEICSISSGGTPSRSIPQYFQGNIPWIKTGEVINEEIFETEEHISPEAIENSSAKLFPSGSLIVAMYGQGDTRGRTAKMGIEATTNQACAVLYNIDNDIIDTDYLWYFLQARYDDLRSLASGNNQPNLNAGKISNYEVVIPPMNVQNEMVLHVADQKRQVNQIKQQAENLRKEALEVFEKEIFE